MEEKNHPFFKKDAIPFLIDIIMALSLVVIKMTWWVTLILWIILICSTIWLIVVLFRKNLKTTIFLTTISLLVLSFCGFYNVRERWVSEHNLVVGAPEQVTINKNTNKDFYLSVTNNQDFTIFDICSSLCISDKSFETKLISITPLIKVGEEENNEFAGCYAVFSNKSIAIDFCTINGLKSHTSKDFFKISIEGKNLANDVKIVFKVDNWTNSPSRTFIDYKNGNVEVSQLMTPPFNPFFPKEKDLKMISFKCFPVNINFKKLEFRELTNKDGIFKK